MIPHKRAVIASWLSHGPEFTNRFLLSYGLVPVKRNDFLSIYQEIKDILTDELAEFLEQKPFYLRKKRGKKTQRFIEIVNDRYDLNLDRKPELFFSPQITRILKNREMRVFIEVLALSGASYERISNAVADRFKINHPIESVDIEEYCHHFFDRRVMDDHEWQYYLHCMEEYINMTDNESLRPEWEDKLFALRNNEKYVILRLGLKDNLNYSELLEVIANNVYDLVAKGFEENESWATLNSKIGTFKSVGEAYVKYYDPSANEQAFEGTVYELETAAIEEFPILEQGQLEYINGEETDS